MTPMREEKPSLTHPHRVVGRSTTSTSAVCSPAPHVRQLGDDGVVDVDDVGADDHLVLATRLDHVDDAVKVGYGLVVGQGLVLEVEAHTGDAVQDGADVVGATDASDDGGCGGVEAGKAVSACAVGGTGTDLGARGLR